MRNLFRLTPVVLAVVLPSGATAACPDAAAIDAYVADVAANRLSKGFGNDASEADAICARDKLIKRLPLALGRVVGYKAGFTNPAVQKRFGVNGPAWGVMYSNLMVESGARLPAKFGARPLFEADFVAVVKDAALAEARTPLEALQHIEAVVPFMELPDLMLEGQFTGNALIATNIGYRGGALGAPIKVETTEAFLAQLADMTVVLTDDGSGKELGRVKGSVLMDNPINAAMWLAQSLKQSGITLRQGDLLSLGGFIPPAPTQPGSSVSVRYLGLPGDPAVSVRFD